MDKKIDIKSLQFGSKIDKTETKREELFSVKEIISPEMIVLSSGLKVRLLGIRTIPEMSQTAIDFLQKKFNKRKVFLKYDSVKYDDANNLLCYVYLDNKTFINRHLIKTKYVAVDTLLDYKYKNKFLEDINNG